MSAFVQFKLLLVLFYPQILQVLSSILTWCSIQLKTFYENQIFKFNRPVSSTNEVNVTKWKERHEKIIEKGNNVVTMPFELYYLLDIF